MSAMQEEQLSGPVLPAGRTRRSFPKEFKADAVALGLDEGRSIASVARSLEIGESKLGNWVCQARVDEGEREGLATTDRAELARLRRENAQLQMGAWSARRGDGLLGEGIGTPARYRWVLARRAEGFPTKLCCNVAGVSRQALCDWKAAHAAGPTDSERREAALVAETGRIHAASGGTYGSPREAAELRSRGHRMNPQARRPAHEGPPDRRDHAPAAQAHHHPRTQQGAAAGPAVQGVLCRRPGPGVVLGYHLRAHRRGLAVHGGGARRRQPPAAGLRHERPDQRAPGRRRARHGRRRTRRTHRGERLSFRPWQPATRRQAPQDRRRCPDRATARRLIFEWLARYNTRRRHTSLNCRTPDEHETRYRHTAGTASALST